MTTPAHRPVFAGVHALLRLLRGLADRPRFFTRSPGQQTRGDQPLPLVCLHREHGRNDLLDALSAQWGAGSAPVPHAKIDANLAEESTRQRWTPHAQDGTEAPPARQLPLLPLLDELRFRLAKSTFGTSRLSRFDHYRLADWLTGRTLPPPRRRDDQLAVVRLLREWSAARPDPGVDEAADTIDKVPSGWTRLGLRLLLWAGRRVGLRWIRERVPGLARESRWFMRGQSYLVPRHSVGFLGFAERLTAGHRESENEQQLKKLLVHAFLEDLRIAYRRRRLRVLPRRAGWRRTTYVTAMLDNVTEANGGWELLRLINEVRNETGELDPLLVIAVSEERPPPPERFRVRPVPPGRAVDALADWRRTLPGRRQLLATDARYLLITLPEQAKQAELDELSDEDRHAWETDDEWAPRRKPRLARRGVAEAALVVALVAAATPFAVEASEHWAVGCAYFDTGDGVATRPVEVGPGDVQCVGYSDRAAQVFGDNERLRFAQRAVFEQNEVASRLYAENPHRPYVSLVYFAGLTSGAGPSTTHAVAEELEGLVLRQRQQNTDSNSEPLLRIVVANGGSAMRAAVEVTQDLLVPLIESDPTIAGVVGLERSVQETAESITVLGVNGIPAIGSTLTSTGLADRSPLYFQLVPGNARHAELVRGYAQEVGASRITVYHPPVDRKDIFATTLVQELEKRFQGSGIAFDTEAWKYSVGELRSLCDEPADRRDEIAFFAGREDDFGDFLRTVTRNCVDRERLPGFVGSDTVSRFVANRASRRHDAFSGLSVSYIGMGSPVVLAGRQCVAGEPGSLPGAGPPLDTFCAGYHELRQEQDAELSEEERPAMPWPGERVGGLYDASGLYLEAVRIIRKQLRERPVIAPHRAAIAQQLRELTFRGATGTIDFGPSRIGDGRSLAILRIDNIRELTRTAGDPVCAYLIGRVYEDSPPDRCPG